MYIEVVVVTYESKSEKGKLVCFLKTVLAFNGVEYVLAEKYITQKKAETLTGCNLEPKRNYPVFDTRA